MEPTGSEKVDAYRDYCAELQPYLVLPKLLEKHPTLLEDIKKYYEDLLENSKIDQILVDGQEPQESELRIFQSIDYLVVPTHKYGVWPDFYRLRAAGVLGYLEEDDCKTLKDNIWVIKRKLPFSILCELFSWILEGSTGEAFEGDIQSKEYFDRKFKPIHFYIQEFSHYSAAADWTDGRLYFHRKPSKEYESLLSLLQRDAADNFGHIRDWHGWRQPDWGKLLKQLYLHSS